MRRWELHKRVAQGHPQSQEDEDRIRDCTVAIQNVPREMPEPELFETLITMGGELPHGNHEIIAVHRPTVRDTGEYELWAYLRWSSPELAARCVWLINEDLRWQDPDGTPIPIRAVPSRTAFRVINDYNRPPHKGQIRMYKFVWTMFD